MEYLHISKLALALDTTTTSLYKLRNEGKVNFEYPYGRSPALVTRGEFDRLVKAHLLATCSKIANAAGEDALKSYIIEIMGG